MLQRAYRRMALRCTFIAVLACLLSVRGRVASHSPCVLGVSTQFCQRLGAAFFVNGWVLHLAGAAHVTQLFSPLLAS
eukprot:2016401-Rhodomonas_salina.3